jgi:hypothetical protein
MGRFLVAAGVRLGAVGFNQHEPRGILEILDKVKSGDPGLFDRGGRVFNTGGPECLDEIRLDMDMHMDDEHGASSFMAHCAMEGGFVSLSRILSIIKFVKNLQIGKNSI